MKQDNKQTTRELAIEWWENTIKDASVRVDWKTQLCFKYIGTDTDYTRLTNDQIEHIYLSEHPQYNSKEETVKGKEVSNLFTGGKWIVRELQTKETDFEIITDEPKGQNNNGYVAYIHGGGYTVPNQAKANAQRIVLCHNVHDELVSALKELIKVATDTTANLCGFDGADELDNSIDKAKELLSRIKQ